MSFEHCHFCLPPVRYPGCQDHCPYYAADIAKHVPGAMEMDNKMADARRVLDWEAQWACAMDPETAKAIRADRAPEQEDTCSMCGKFCAVRSMNKALNGEYIDIL